MVINNLKVADFAEILNRQLSASGPVRSIEHLYGRERELQIIQQALYADGRHIFIFGDRGVGKSSLAASAASQYQSSDALPIQIGCGSDTKFYQTIEELTEQVLKRANADRNYDVKQSINVKFYTIEWQGQNKSVAIKAVDSMYSAVEAIEQVAQYHSQSPVVVIDEFDQIGCETERQLFANFLKNVGDRGVRVKFIFTGIAKSLYELLGSHQSSYRQLDTIELKRLNWSARTEIVSHAASAFNLEVDSDVLDNIAKISNGFPYYVHLLAEKVLWVAYNYPRPIKTLTMELFGQAVDDAILSIQAQLQLPYNKATLHRTNDYREIVWATADSDSLFRYSEKLFDSYLRVHVELYGKAPAEQERPLSRDKFMRRIGNLTKPNFGQILERHPERSGIFSYRENILRGFVALKAYEAGIVLHGDVPDEPKVPSAMARQNQRHAAGKSRVPKSVKFRGEK